MQCHNPEGGLLYERAYQRAYQTMIYYYINKLGSKIRLCTKSVQGQQMGCENIYNKEYKHFASRWSCESPADRSVVDNGQHFDKLCSSHLFVICRIGLSKSFVFTSTDLFFSA